MYFGAELVKVTPLDFLRDALLWAKLIDKYKGTMTAAPNFAYNLFARRLRQAPPGQFDLSCRHIAGTTVAVSFTACGAGMVVDQVDADMLAVLRRAVPSTRGSLRRVVCLGKPLHGVEVRVVDDGAELPVRGVGVIQVRGEPVTDGYTTMAGFVNAQDDRGWYGTGDPGYLTEDGQIVVCGRSKT
jgi:fatty-acyl-CoA synthase